jgi:hypothetical protein
MNEEIRRFEENLLDFQETLAILDSEISEVKNEFEKTQPLI